MQARSTLEGATIVLAASRIDEAALVTLRGTLDEMRKEIEAGRKPLDQDRKFHATIAEQSGNTVLARLVGDLFDDRHSPISTQLRVRFEDRGTWTYALQEHEAIWLRWKAAIRCGTGCHAHSPGKLKTALDRYVIQDMPRQTICREEEKSD